MVFLAAPGVLAAAVVLTRASVRLIRRQARQRRAEREYLRRQQEYLLRQAQTAPRITLPNTAHSHEPEHSADKAELPICSGAKMAPAKLVTGLQLYAQVSELWDLDRKIGDLIGQMNRRWHEREARFAAHRLDLSDELAREERKRLHLASNTDEARMQILLAKRRLRTRLTEEQHYCRVPRNVEDARTIKQRTELARSDVETAKTNFERVFSLEKGLYA